MQATLIGFHLYLKEKYPRIYTDSSDEDKRIRKRTQYNDFIWGTSIVKKKLRLSFYFDYLSYLRKRSIELQEQYEREFFEEVYYA